MDLLNNLPQSISDPNASNLPQEPTAQGTADRETEYYRENQKLDLSFRSEALASLKVVNATRIRYAWWLLGLTIFWIAIIITIVMLNMFSIGKLSDSVLITLVTTTTASVLGLFILVLKYFFPGGPNSPA